MRRLKTSKCLLVPCGAAQGATRCGGEADKAVEGTRRHGLSFWDALLWATADRIGVKDLLTEDSEYRRVLGGVTFVDPFNSGNEALLAEILPLS